MCHFRLYGETRNSMGATVKFTPRKNQRLQRETHVAKVYCFMKRVKYHATCPPTLDVEEDCLVCDHPPTVKLPSLSWGAGTY